MNRSTMGAHHQQQQQQQQQHQYNSSTNFNNGAPPPPPPAVLEVHHCLWDDCQRVAPDAESLYLHLCNDHIGRKSTQNLCLTCHWKGCEISCAKRDHITSHLRVHTPLKPHGCPVCSKTFKRPQDLKKHERIHTQEHHSAHKHSKAAVSEDPEFADRVLAGTAPAEKKSSAGLLVPRGRAARESFSSSGSREGSTPEFASPKSNSLSPHSLSSHSDPLSTPPPDHFLPYPHLTANQDPNNFPPHNSLLQNPYALQNNMYTLAGGGGYPNQPQLHHPQANHYPGQQGWDGGAQTGQKRTYDLGGFFDEVKKRKVEPTYDQEMARRLEEMTRGLATVGSGGSPGDGNPSPPLPTHFNPLPSPSHLQLPQHSSIPNNASFPNLGQPNFLDQFNTAAPLPDFHSEAEVASTNSFLFNLLMGATAQQQNLRGGSPSFNGVDGSRPNGEQQHQQQHQQSHAPPHFDANVLAQMGIAGMPGLDPSVLFGSIQLQQQFQLQQQQQQQIRELQEQLALQQRMAQQGNNFGSNGPLYPNLHDPNSFNNNNHAQQQFSRRTSAPNSGPSSNYGTPPISLSNRPIAQLPSGNGRSSLPSAPPILGMQTLFTGNTPQLPTPVSAVPTFDSSAPSPANSHASSSHYSSSSSEIFSFNEASDHESSQFARNGSTGSYHQHPSPGLSTSFDSLAKSRGPAIQTGLAPVNLLANTYRMMEPLSSAAPRESNERGSGGVEEEEEEDEAVMENFEEEQDEKINSPSDVAMKGPHQSQTSSSSSSEEILSSSPPLPSTLLASGSLQDFDPELKLPSINSSYSLSHFRTSSTHQGSASPTPSSPSSSHSQSTTRPTTPTNGTTLPPLSTLYPDLARPWSADELVKGVHEISGLGGAAERESKAKEAERHVELIKALLIAVNDKWRKTVAMQAGQVKVEVKVEEAEMMRAGGGVGLTA